MCPRLSLIILEIDALMIFSLQIHSGFYSSVFQHLIQQCTYRSLAVR